MIVIYQMRAGSADGEERWVCMQGTRYFVLEKLENLPIQFICLSTILAFLRLRIVFLRVRKESDLCLSAHVFNKYAYILT